MPAGIWTGLSRPATFSSLGMLVTIIDCTPSRFSGHSSFSTASLKADILPATDGSFT